MFPSSFWSSLLAAAQNDLGRDLQARTTEKAPAEKGVPVKHTVRSEIWARLRKPPQKQEPAFPQAEFAESVGILPETQPTPGDNALCVIR